MLDRLVERVEQELRLPEIVGERCVHAVIEQASCRACVDVCPRRAWRLDDDSLNIDPERCDGCGLCAAVCPPAAIVHQQQPVQRERGLAAFAACQQTGLSASEDSGVIPCLHALGLRDLLRLYRRGRREIAISRGDCDGCARGSAPRLDQTVAALNRLLQRRALAPLVLIELPAARWQRALGPSEPKQSRRLFLRRAVANALDEGIKFAGPAPAEQVSATPVGQLLPARSAFEPLFYVPQIDARRCNGCDACAKLCPSDAIGYEQDERGCRYRLVAENCSGCGICDDVCDRQAVTVARGRAPSQTTVELAESRCRACGVPFHIPAKAFSTVSGASDLCRICAKTSRYRNLYQVLD